MNNQLMLLQMAALLFFNVRADRVPKRVLLSPLCRAVNRERILTWHYHGHAIYHGRVNYLSRDNAIYPSVNIPLVFEKIAIVLLERNPACCLLALLH
jgi:hypothetical protein